jgi:hypothetical protein
MIKSYKLIVDNNCLLKLLPPKIASNGSPSKEIDEQLIKFPNSDLCLIYGKINSMFYKLLLRTKYSTFMQDKAQISDDYLPDYVYQHLKSAFALNPQSELFNIELFNVMNFLEESSLYVDSADFYAELFDFYKYNLALGCVNLYNTPHDENPIKNKSIAEIYKHHKHHNQENNFLNISEDTSENLAITLSKQGFLLPSQINDLCEIMLKSVWENEAPLIENEKLRKIISAKEAKLSESQDCYSMFDDAFFLQTIVSCKAMTQDLQSFSDFSRD